MRPYVVRLEPLSSAKTLHWPMRVVSLGIYVAGHGWLPPSRYAQ